MFPTSSASLSSQRAMTAKQFMNRARRVDKEIAALEQMIERTRDNLTRITQNYDSDGAQSTKDPHKYDRLLELESKVTDKVNEQLAVKAETIDVISQLKDQRHRIILTEHYLNMKTWEQVAVEINYSWRQVMNLHGNALQEVQKIINENRVD